MDNNLMQSYLLIGKVHSIVEKANNLEEALRDSLRLILAESCADYAVVWYMNPDEGKLHPYYWIFPSDLSSVSHVSGEGDVGNVYNEEKSIRRLSYKDDPDSYTTNDLSDVSIGSLVTVPLISKYEKLGTIQFIKSTEKGQFTDDEADICEILSNMIAISVEDNVKLQKPWVGGNIIYSIRNVQKEYVHSAYTSLVLKGINLDIYEGELLVFLGESGCGKSSLLNIIGGMDNATAGELLFMGKDISNASQTELTHFRRHNIGFVFQSYNLMPNLNAKQNLDLIAELAKDPMSSSECLKLVGLDKKEKSYPSELSGGQQQRISIARALVKRPKLILADEPTAALDYTTSIEVLSVMEKVLATGTTIVMVTHNEEITRMANRVVRIRDGKIHEVTINRHPVHATDLVW